MERERDWGNDTVQMAQSGDPAITPLGIANIGHALNYSTTEHPELISISMTVKLINTSKIKTEVRITSVARHLHCLTPQLLFG